MPVFAFDKLLTTFVRKSYQNSEIKTFYADILKYQLE